MKQRLNFAYKRAREMSQKQAQKYKLSYDKKVKGTQLQIDDLVLVKRVAWKGRHKIQNKWEPEEYVVLSQPNKSVPVYKVKPVGNGKERVLHRNMLLPLGIKFVPENDSDIDSDQGEEPEFEQCQVERQISEKLPQTTDIENMTPLAQSNLEHGQDIVSSELEHVETPVDHVEHIQQGSMAPPTAISTDQLIDPNMSLDPKFLVPIEDTVGSDPTQSTHLSDKDIDPSLVLPSTNDNSDSLMKTEEFLDFVDDLSQEPSPLSDREGTCKNETVPSDELEETLHSVDFDSKISQSVNSSNEAQDISIVNVPKGNSVESTDISITESQFSSTMPYCEESLVAKLDPMGESQFLSAQPCHKEETTLSHEGASIVTEEGTSDSCTKDCSSGTSASKIPTEVTNVKFDSVSDSNTESHIDHDKMQSSEKSIEHVVPSEPVETSHSPPKVRRSTRSTKGIPPTRYGSVTSHKVNVSTKLGKWMNSVSKKIDDIYDHVFD